MQKEHQAKTAHVVGLSFTREGLLLCLKEKLLLLEGPAFAAPRVLPGKSPRAAVLGPQGCILMLTPSRRAQRRDPNGTKLWETPTQQESFPRMFLALNKRSLIVLARSVYVLDAVSGAVRARCLTPSFPQGAYACDVAQGEGGRLYVAYSGATDVAVFVVAALTK